MTVAGLGCRKGVGMAVVMAAIDAALAMNGLTRAALDALATVRLKENEAALREAALALRLPLLVPAEEAIRRARVASHSGRSLALTGVQSASEAAALAAAGEGSRLLSPRLSLGGVTCALAVGGDIA